MSVLFIRRSLSPTNDMAITLTSENKNTLILSGEDKINVNDTWDEATYTWNDALGTWDNQLISSLESKNALSVSNEAKL